MTCAHGVELRRRLASTLNRTDLHAKEAQDASLSVLRDHESRCRECRGIPTLGDLAGRRSLRSIVEQEFPKDREPRR